jgi:DNA-binding IscR family transcriptional regulator
MKFSAKTEYACLAVLELARVYESGEPVRMRTIAEEHGIPSRFLVEEVMTVVDGQDKLPNPAAAKSPIRRALLKAWRDVAVARHEALRDITFADLAQRASGEVEQMYHI